LSASPVSKEKGAATCHCGLPQAYQDCCHRFVSGREVAATAQQLMRSRYSAFVECDEAYLLASWHPQTCPSRVSFDAEQCWLGLRIKDCTAGGSTDSVGTVEFVARFKINGKGHRLHERSRFEKIRDRWYYLDGEHL
jgi:SEC-C motif-containing protein